ncbi:MAG: response regulator [Anaerolineae bacterium]|nr:response regulator [Anaerolineae bacterium]
MPDASAALRALIVEDDRSWQQILSEILTDAGLEVDIVNNVEDAITSLRSVSHRLAVVDLALGDGNYDNQDGLCVLDAVRRQDPGCVTLMLTGFATVELAVSVLTEYGAFSCLRKETFNRTEFRTLVRQALASAPPIKTLVPTDNIVKIPSKDMEVNTFLASGIVLVVEDDAGWRTILSELLTDAGYQTRLCTSFGEALGCLRRETYTLAVVDLSLAGFDHPDEFSETQPISEDILGGYQLLATTRASRIPTIVVSGVATPDNIERAYREQNVFAYLEKQTFDRRTFLQTVKEAHNASSADTALQLLTQREQEVLMLLAQGMTNKEIAGTLVITTNTVKRHLKAIFSKLEVHTRAAAAAKAITAGILV